MNRTRLSLHYLYSYLIVIGLLVFPKEASDCSYPMAITETSCRGLPEC